MATAKVNGRQDMKARKLIIAVASVALIALAGGQAVLGLLPSMPRW